MNEIWRKTIVYDGFYEVSSFGRIRNTKTKKIRKLFINNAGYYYFAVSSIRTPRAVNVHSCVAEAFLGERKEKYVDHIDSDRTNNRLENLRYVTPSENTRKMKVKNRKWFFMMKKRKCAQRYGAQIFIFKKRYLLGSFLTMEEATKVAQDTHREFYGYA